MSPENKTNFGVYAVCSVVTGRGVIQTACSFHDFIVINNVLLCAHTTTIQIIHVYLMCIQNLFIIYMMDIIYICMNKTMGFLQPSRWVNSYSFINYNFI